MTIGLIGSDTLTGMKIASEHRRRRHESDDGGVNHRVQADIFEVDVHAPMLVEHIVEAGLSDHAPRRGDRGVLEGGEHSRQAEAGKRRARREGNRPRCRC